MPRTTNQAPVPLAVWSQAQPHRTRARVCRKPPPWLVQRIVDEYGSDRDATQNLLFAPPASERPGDVSLTVASGDFAFGDDTIEGKRVAILVMPHSRREGVRLEEIVQRAECSDFGYTQHVIALLTQTEFNSRACSGQSTSLSEHADVLVFDALETADA